MSAWLYSRACRCRVDLTALLSEALARQRRMLPWTGLVRFKGEGEWVHTSSLPLRRYLESIVQQVRNTLWMISRHKSTAKGAYAPLHPLGMVNIARLTLVAAPYPDCAIVRSRHELLACRGELDVHDGSHMALVDVLGLFEVSGVEYIDVVICWELVVSLLF